VLVGCAVLAVACGGTPTRPTSAARIARLSRTRFVAFGDSLTAGEVTEPLGAAPSDIISTHVVVSAASYPVQLHAMLDARYAPQAGAIFVANAGVGGESIFRGVQRFEQSLSMNFAQAVIIMEGLNNLVVDGVDVTTSLMREMVRTAEERNVSVFVASMVPTVAGRQRSQNPALLEAYNAALKKMSVEEGVTFVDLYTPMLPEAPALIGVDGLHPTEAGYRRIADIFLTAISATLEE
jgi:lysophospholipase L1-like esterase